MTENDARRAADLSNNMLNVPRGRRECRLCPEMSRAVLATCRLSQGQIDAAIRTLATQVLATAEQPVKPRLVRRNKKWVYQPV